MPRHNLTKRRFLPSSRREWLVAGGILVFGAAAVGAAAWARAHFSNTVFAVLTLAVLAMEPWIRDRHGRRKGRSGDHALHYGRMGIVTETCAPTGRVRVDGTLWAAKSLDAQAPQPGECVYIHDGEGLVLHVSREEPRS